MSNIEVDYKRALKAPDNAEKLCLVFMLLEFALIEIRWLNDKAKFAEPDWIHLANELGASFFEQINQSGKASELIDKPPLRLHNIKNSLEWRSCQNEDDSNI